MSRRFILLAMFLAAWSCGQARADDANLRATLLAALANTNGTAPVAAQPATNTNAPADHQKTRPGVESAIAPDTKGEAPAASSAMDTLDDHQKFGPGDKVMFQVVEDQDPPQSLTITESGDLAVPYYGLVHAAGKTCRELAAEIKESLEKNLYYRATVVVALEVANRTGVTGKVYVTGQVRQPGGFDIPAKENLTVSKAILSAGGFSDFSDKKHVRLIRKTTEGDKTFVVNVVAVWQGHLDQDVPVQAGDTVVVPARMVNY